jgi:hypothetical protein
LERGLAAAPAFAESPPDPNTRADAVLAYRQEAIHFGSSTSVHVRGSGASVRRELMIYQGEMNRRLSAEELVRRTDRRDLIREMEAKQRRGRILAVAVRAR